jgi:TPR repeat protein
VPTAPTLDPNSEEVVALVKRGEQLAAAGDMAAARLTLRRAADAHNARAALALGATYDPNVLQNLGIYGIEPDVAQTRRWYERAKEFGSAEAQRRLETLASRNR